MTYTMDIEKPVNVVEQHGFHLGTDRAIAETFVIDRLRADPEVVSIALRRDGKLVKIYNFRDIEGMAALFGELRQTPEQYASDFGAGYDAGWLNASKLAPGKLFRGAFGYADNYAGSTKACRETGAWKGACAGYIAGLPPHKGIVVDENGFIIEFEYLMNNTQPLRLSPLRKWWNGLNTARATKIKPQRKSDIEVTPAMAYAAAEALCDSQLISTACSPARIAKYLVPIIEAALDAMPPTNRREIV